MNKFIKTSKISVNHTGTEHFYNHDIVCELIFNKSFPIVNTNIYALIENIADNHGLEIRHFDDTGMILVYNKTFTSETPKSANMRFLKIVPILEYILSLLFKLSPKSRTLAIMHLVHMLPLMKPNINWFEHIKLILYKIILWLNISFNWIWL